MPFPGLVRFRGLKQFADGSLGGHTAAMSRPYADRPDTTGTLRYSEADREVAEAVLAGGGDVAIHAIGDHACEVVISHFEAWVRSGTDPRRLRLEHASVLTPGQVERLARIGVFVSVQPTFLGSEAGWLEKRLGAQRMPWAYPLRSLVDAGTRLAAGSDSPVEPPHPLRAMALAQTRDGIQPDAERISAADAFAMATSGGADCLGEPRPLAPGSPADLVLVDTHPLASTPEALRRGRVLRTWVGGREIDLTGVGRTWPVAVD